MPVAPASSEQRKIVIRTSHPDIANRDVNSEEGDEMKIK
jgi:hypothetical protein